jgi:hypothetical protein
MYNTKKKKDLLKRIGSVNKDTKDNIKKEAFEVTTLPYENLGRNVKDEVIYFEIEPNENRYSVLVKELINTENIKKSDVYNIVGRKIGYRMIYELTKKPILTVERFEMWLQILKKSYAITLESSLEVYEDNDDYIYYEIESDDNDFTYHLKKLINKLKLNQLEIYDAVGRETGYRIIYELSKKNITSLRTFDKWLEILDATINIDIEDNN